MQQQALRVGMPGQNYIPSTAREHQPRFRPWAPCWSGEAAFDAGDCFLELEGVDLLPAISHGGFTQTRPYLRLDELLNVAHNDRQGFAQA